MNQLLKIFIKETVEEIVQEVTARKGPRTGGFEFDPAVKNRIYIKAVEANKQLQPRKKARKKKFVKLNHDQMSRFKVKDPITGEYVYIFVQYYLDTNKKAATGWYDPATNVIGLNVHDLSYDTRFKSAIPHELTHFFNLKHFHRDSFVDEEDFEKYALQPHEKSAFVGGTLVSAMESEAQKIVRDIKAKSLVAKKLGENLVAKPFRLYERLRNQENFSILINLYMKDPQLLRNLNKAAYDITQAFILPALQELHLPMIKSGMRQIAKEIAREIETNPFAAKETNKTFSLANILVKHPWTLYKKWRDEQQERDDFKFVLDFYAKIPNSPFAEKINAAAQEIIRKVIEPVLYLSKI